MIKTLTLGLALALPLTAWSQTSLKHSSYVEFDGETQYLSVASHPDLDAVAGKSYTYTLWVYGYRTLIYGDAPRVLSRLDFGKKPIDSLNRSGYELMALRTTSNNFFGAHLTDAAGTSKQAIEGWGKTVEGIQLREWYHCALVVNREDASIRMYVDGVEVRKSEADIRAWVAQNNLPLIIGAGQKDGKIVSHFAGRLDNIRIYSKALRVEELRKDRETERIDGQTAGLIAGFDFDNLIPGDSEVKDVTGRHTAKLNGYPSLTGHRTIKTYTAHRTNGHLVGRGANQALSVFALGISEEHRLESVEITTPEASHIKNISRYRLFVTDNGDRYDHRSPGTLIAEGKPSLGVTTLRAVKKAPQINKNSRLWLVADVAAKATEGDKIKTQIKSIKLAGVDTFVPKSDLYHHEIVLQRVLVWTPGEDKSAHYRIPSLVRLDNGHLVAGIDRRKTTDYDLPADIDVEVKISRDNGRTWSRPITVAKGTPEQGFGDAAIATDGKTLYMVMVSGSGLWFYPSQAKKPLQMYFSKSTDGGLSWTPVVEITDQVYTDRYPNGGFFGSGNGIITSKGRIAFVAAMRTEAKWGGNMDNVMVYSDDFGKTWHSSSVARTNGDESKIVELANGDLLISSRNRAWVPTPRTYTISKDHGTTWSTPATWSQLMGNACNTALTRYSLAGNGKDTQNILLHTLIESKKRTNLRIYLSEDEAKTWNIGNTICDGEAAYSEVTRLKNGNIGIISEEDDRPAYDIYFTEVSLDWIKKGTPAPKQ